MSLVLLYCGGIIHASHLTTQTTWGFLIIQSSVQYVLLCVIQAAVVVVACMADVVVVVVDNTQATIWSVYFPLWLWIPNITSRPTCFYLRFHSKRQTFALIPFYTLETLLNVIVPPPPLPCTHLPCLPTYVLAGEGGVWRSHCLYSNGSVRWAIDDGVQSLLIPRLGETLWCGGTWKERAAARDPERSLTIIKYYHPEARG